MDDSKIHHGRENAEAKMEDAAAPSAALKERPSILPGGTGTYAQVTMIGHYGALCAGNQMLRFKNVSLAQARQLRWDNFGVCGAQITCFDSQGNVVHEE